MNINYENIKLDGYMPQGIITINNKIIISAYKKDCYERLYIYDANNFLKYIELNIYGHAGGLAYDDVNKIIFVSEEHHKVALLNDKFEYMKSIQLPIVASTMCFNNGILSICSFVGRNNGIRIDIKFNNDSYEIINKFNIPRMVQGICFYNKYTIYSESFGKHLRSSLSIYEDSNYLGTYYLKQSGLEGIYCDNKLVCLFEFGNSKLLNIDVNNIISNLKNKKNKRIELMRNIVGKKYDKKHHI